MEETSGALGEFAAMKKIHDELEPLEPDARKRVLDYLINLLDVKIAGRHTSSDVGATALEQRTSDSRAELDESYGTFAELFDAADPKSNADKALVASYWLQVHERVEGLDAQSANNLLKNLGHGLTNVTVALSALKEQKPSLVLQLKKSGSSQQARKTYKVTMAGIKAVQSMIGSGEAS